MVLKINAVTLSLFGLFVLSACNEKIAPSLSSPASSVATQTGVVRKFKVTEKSSSIFGYVMHKAGEDKDVECEIEATQGTFESPDENQSIPATHDVTCYLEAEESFLHYNGIEFQLDVDKGICEKISYTPYSFYHFQPGDSTRNMYKTACDDMTKLYLSVQANRDTFYANPLNASFACEYYTDPATLNYDSVTTHTLTTGFTNDEDALCVFDYSKTEVGEIAGPNCDPGTITTTPVTCTFGDTDNDGVVDLGEVPVCGTDGIAQKTKCGGYIGNCVSGPILEIRPKTYTSYGEVYDSSDEDYIKKGFSKSWEHKAPDSLDMSTNMYLANFTRQCSGIPTATSPHLPTDFEVTTDPDSSLFMDYTRLGIESHSTFSDSEFNPYGLTAVIYASDPFRGASVINPYYEFACLDGAHEIKARIRVVVRDWDRTFEDTAAGIAQVSDWGFNNLAGAIANQTNGDLAKMDTGLRFSENDNAQTYPDGNRFNDFWDWDDFFSPDADPLAGYYNPFVVDATGACTGIDEQTQPDITYGPKAKINFPRWWL